MSIFFHTQDAKVGRIFELLSKKINIPVDGNRLLYGRKELQSDKILPDYGIEKGSTLFLVFRLRGGSEQTSVKVLDHTVELSDAPDMITWDDDPENKRVKMPCGHAISKYLYNGDTVLSGHPLLSGQ